VCVHVCYCCCYCCCSCFIIIIIIIIAAAALPCKRRGLPFLQNVSVNCKRGRNVSKCGRSSVGASILIKCNRNSLLSRCFDGGKVNSFYCVSNITFFIFLVSWRRCISSVMCHDSDKAQRNIPASLTDSIRLRDVIPSSA
jgi:hypothetical protein